MKKKGEEVNAGALIASGPDRYMGSSHVEIADTMTAAEIGAMTRRIVENVYLEHTVIMIAVGGGKEYIQASVFYAIRSEFSCSLPS